MTWMTSLKSTPIWDDQGGGGYLFWLREKQLSGNLIRLSYRRCLIFTYTPGDNLSAIVILSAHGAAGHSAQHCDLPSVCQCVGNWALKKLFRVKQPEARPMQGNRRKPEAFGKIASLPQAMAAARNHAKPVCLAQWKAPSQKDRPCAPGFGLEFGLFLRC